MIQNLQEQVDSLQQRVIELENKILVKDRNLSPPTAPGRLRNVLSDPQNIPFSARK